MFFINKHDNYLQELITRISPQYDSLATNYKFRISRKSTSEIDLYARRGKKIDLYEVKCSYRIAKAKQQLKRAKRCLMATGNTYFYCGSSGKILMVDIK